MRLRNPLVLSIVTLLSPACGGDNSAQYANEAGAPPDGTVSLDASAFAETGTGDSSSIDSGADSGAQDATVNDATNDVAADSAAQGDALASRDAGVPCPPDGGIPDGLAAELRCTGLYSDWANKVIAPGVTQYTPGVVLWSDGAAKTRWLWLPPGTKIDTTDMDEWVFPVGTKIWKQFAAGSKIIETRLIWKQPDASWTYAVYRWSNDGLSTYNLVDGETNVNGTTYEVPATWKCTKCHQGRKDVVLGLDLIGTGIRAAQGVTLSSLVAQGLLTKRPPVIDVVIPEDVTMKAAAALGWMHMNCGVTCHNPNPAALGGYSGMRLKLLTSQLFPEAGVAKVVNQDIYAMCANVTSRLMPNGHPYLRIAPGDSAQSLIPLVSLAREPDAGAFSAMPPLVSHVPDVADVRLIQNWIDAIPDGGLPP
jgi:hypothetical protein